jgi:L-cysteine:1D-myo-inositol 2-amino-2-deoxy-alpha-D-glucopyranoside ligase
MSKSLGNLVFVSGLLAGGADPMAVRLAILAHHYHEDWDWDDAGLTQATARLERWRAALCAQGQPAASAKPSPPEQPGADVLTAVRERLADDLDTPGALAVVDAWADATLADAGSPQSGSVRDTVDALLGIAL